MNHSGDGFWKPIRIFHHFLTIRQLPARGENNVELHLYLQHQMLFAFKALRASWMFCERNSVEMMNSKPGAASESETTTNPPGVIVQCAFGFR